MTEAHIRAAVAERAAYRCEYCLLSTVDHCWRFHVEHIVTAIDPDTGKITPLFNPRIHEWLSHFQIVSEFIEGITDTGRATVRLLHMNAENRRDLRRELG